MNRMTSDKKQELITASQRYVEERIDRIRQAIADLEDALKLETKCSVGDKYETGRAMLHLEFEKLSGQLEQYAQLKKTVDLIQKVQPSGEVAFGSVVETTGANYILAIPAGKLVVQEKEYFAVGVASPIAKLLLGKKRGDSFSFNGTDATIIDIF